VGECNHQPEERQCGEGYGTQADARTETAGGGADTQREGPEGGNQGNTQLYRVYAILLFSIMFHGILTLDHFMLTSFFDCNLMHCKTITF